MAIKPRVHMNQSLTWIFCVLIQLLALHGAKSYAQELSSYRLYHSAYFLGRADTGVADAEGYESIFYNPAGLALGKGLYKEIVFASPSLIISDDTKNLARKIIIEENNSVSSLREHVGKNQHVGAENFSGIVFRRASLGAFASTQNNLLIYKSPEYRAIEILEANSVTNTGITFSIAEQFFNESFAIGTSLIYLNQSHADLSINVIDAEDISEQLSSDDVQQNYTGFSANLGIILKSDGRIPLKMGLTIQNVGDTKLDNKTSDGPKRTLPQIVNLGSSATFKSHASYMKFLLDIRDITSKVEPDFFRKTHIGAELNFANFFGFTGGVHQGYPSFGVFLNLYLFRFDLGSYTSEIGSTPGIRPDNRYFLSIKSGI